MRYNAVNQGYEKTRGLLLPGSIKFYQVDNEANFLKSSMKWFEKYTVGCTDKKAVF